LLEDIISYAGKSSQSLLEKDKKPFALKKKAINEDERTPKIGINKIALDLKCSKRKIVKPNKIAIIPARV
jgi:hypothetical protein